ncbi:hypothetical protein C8R44DRAFT_882677 [Mycena epipterygia]|nr:hypothetical protein C8R44DRAFT_882677 [Mycena epipterygia]
MAESQTPDPLADAAQAMADAQRAIAAARAAPAPVALALAESQKKCAALHHLTHSMQLP